MIDLPLSDIDAHERTLAAPPERAWGALARVLRRATSGGMGGYARIVGCDPLQAEGIFPTAGSAIPGFRVVRASPPRELVLAGRHRCSRYELEVRLGSLDDGRGTRLVARTRAAFPGATGAAYQLAVIRTGGHALAMKALLRKVAIEAQRTEG